MTQHRRMLDGAGGSRAWSAVGLLDAVESVGLRGRGGGRFPVARKLRTALGARGAPVLVVNAAEGEPASRKDRTLLALNPHLVLDGAQAAARAIGAREVVLAAHEPSLLSGVLAERPRETSTRLVALQPGYVRSEASAVVSAASGGHGLPTTRWLPQAERGPGRRPWLVQNAETFACIGLLARHGAEWYRQVGAADEPGTQLLTIGGGVRRPQVVEVPVGTTLRGAVDLAGGVIGRPQAFLVGGYAGRWLRAADCLDVPLSTQGLRAAGGTLGAGLVIALPVGACGLATTARVVRYLAAQSARQCGPCLNGLPALAAALQALVDGRDTRDRIHRWCGQLPGRGACSHPDGAVALVSSALEVFGGPTGHPALELPT